MKKLLYLICMVGLVGPIFADVIYTKDANGNVIKTENFTPIQANQSIQDKAAEIDAINSQIEFFKNRIIALTADRDAKQAELDLLKTAK